MKVTILFHKSSARLVNAVPIVREKFQYQLVVSKVRVLESLQTHDDW